MLQLRFGTSRRKHLEHTTPLNFANIGVQFCFLLIQTFAFDHYEIKTEHFQKHIIIVAYLFAKGNDRNSYG